MFFQIVMKLIMYGLPKELLKRFDFRWVFRNLFKCAPNYTFEENSVLSAAIPNYPMFSVEPIGKDLSLKSRIQFNESQTGFDMIAGNTQKNTIYKR
jgi:hypothetical protein